MRFRLVGQRYDNTISRALLYTGYRDIVGTKSLKGPGFKNNFPEGSKIATRGSRQWRLAAIINKVKECHSTPEKRCRRYGFMDFKFGFICLSYLPWSRERKWLSELQHPVLIVCDMF
jgi:hypothetical protein